MKSNVQLPTPVRISAIMGAYNSATTINEAIDSVLAQTCADWELIVVDDGSTDATRDIVQQYTDPRIRLISRPVNGGPGASRNDGIRAARGRYIAICDSDDRSLPTRFERLATFLDDHPGIDVVSSQVLYFSGDAEPRSCVVYPITADAIRQRFAKGKMGIPHGASIMRATALARVGGYNEAMTRTEDFELFHRMYIDSQFYTFPEVHLHYRHDAHGGSLRKFYDSTKYYRYALYCDWARRHGAGRQVMKPDAFARQWHTQLVLLTYDLARFLVFNLRSRVTRRQVLR